jgi:hypothetical protein
MEQSHFDWFTGNRRIQIESWGEDVLQAVGIVGIESTLLFEVRQTVKQD